VKLDQKDQVDSKVKVEFLENEAHPECLEKTDNVDLLVVQDQVDLKDLTGHQDLEVFPANAVFVDVLDDKGHPDQK